MKHDEPAAATDPQRPPKGDPLIGRELAGRYRIKRVIARGGMGSVYLAEQLPLGRAVAVKVLHEPPSGGEKGEFEQRFFLEASALAKLSHPHTVTLHDYGEDSGPNGPIFYLVMEYVDGRPLSHLLQAEGPLPPERAIRLMLQVARAVKNAHRHGIVHRDLKPSNLLVGTNTEGEDVVKVVDFGLVKLSEGDQAITVSGMILGSPHCMAPEQVQGSDVDERTDIYALGILLFRAITGQYPFHGATTTATMIAHLQQPVPTLAEVAPQLQAPEGLEAVIRQCLAKDPAQRYQDVGDLIKALGRCAHIAPEEVSAVSTIITPPQRSRSLVPAVVAVLALLLAVGTLTWVGLRTPEPPAAPEAQRVEVSLRTTPSGATVTSGGNVLGTTPLTVSLESRQSPDLRRFELHLQGHISASVERDLRAAGPILIELELEPLPLQAETPPPPSPTPPVPAPTPEVERAPERPKAQTRRDPDPGAQTPPANPSQKPDESSTPAGYKSNPFD